MKQRKYSVVVPVYNVENYLKECLDSILAYQGDLEVIAVDDGSTDSSGRILDEYRDERLKVFHKENEGLFRTWQFGLNHATGEYVIFVDSDDYLDAKIFERCNEILFFRDFDLIQFGWTNVYEDKQLINEGCACFAPEMLSLEGDDLSEYLEKHFYHPQGTEEFFPTCRWGKVFSLERLKELLPLLLEDISMFEDDSTTIPYLTTVRSLCIFKEPYYFYRMARAGSISNCSEKLGSRFSDCKRVVKYFEEFGGGHTFTREWLDFYIKRNYYCIVAQAIDAKEYSFAKKVLRDGRYHELIKRERGLKNFLLKHNMLRTLRMMRNLKRKRTK